MAATRRDTVDFGRAVRAASSVMDIEPRDSRTASRIAMMRSRTEADPADRAGAVFHSAGLVIEDPLPAGLNRLRFPCGSNVLDSTVGRNAAMRIGRAPASVPGG